MKYEQEQAFYGSFYEDSYAAVGVFDKSDARQEIKDGLALMGAEPPAHVLDWCGGWGRHTIPAAQLGYRMTILDFSERYLARAHRDAQAAGVEVGTIASDFRTTPETIRADYAVNLFTAGLGHYSKEDDRMAVASLYAALKPGAGFLIETLALSWLMRHFQETSWRESADGTKRLFEKRLFDWTTNTIATTWNYIDKTDGREESHTLDLRVYSPAELIELLESVGFRNFQLYSTFDGKPFTLESKRIVLVSWKIG